MSRRILVVDDEYDLLSAICGFLEDEGYEVQGCSSGAEALEVLKSSTVPDLILLDVMMPGLSGFEVVERIRKLDGASTLPVVLMSAASSERLYEKGPWNAFLRKPFEIDKLIATVQQYVRD